MLKRREPANVTNLMNPMNSFRWRLGLWLVVCLAIALLFFRDFWAAVPGLLNAEALHRSGVYGWGILGVCLFWLFLKKDQIHRRMKSSTPSVPYALSGVVLAGVAYLLPASSVFVNVLRMLGVFWGAFAILFGRAAIIPGVILAIYAFALAFPVLVEPLAAGPWSRATLQMTLAISRLLDLPLSVGAGFVSVTTPSGLPLSIGFTSECVGQITMGIFLAIFALMMLDIRVPWKRALPLLIFGILGTTAQNLVRIQAVMWAAHLYGPAGFEAAHRYVALFIFPLWYALFAYVYMRVAPSSKSSPLA